MLLSNSVLWFYIYDERFGFGRVRGNTVKCFIQSMFCKINTLCGTLEKETYSPNIYVTSMFEIKSKNQIKEVTKKLHTRLSHHVSGQRLQNGSNAPPEQWTFFLLQILHTTKTYSRGENASKELIQKQEKYNPIHFAHLLHNNTQWSQNEMTSFTILMAFCLLFYTIYNHFNFISLFLIQGRKKAYVQ